MSIVLPRVIPNSDSLVLFFCTCIFVLHFYLCLFFVLQMYFQSQISSDPHTSLAETLKVKRSAKRLKILLLQWYARFSSPMMSCQIF